MERTTLMNLKKYDRDLLAAVESTDKKLLLLFRRAIERGESDLELILAKHAISQVSDGPAIYHCMARNQYVQGHNHHGAAKVAAGKARPRDFQFYGNALIVDEDGTASKLLSVLNVVQTHNSRSLLSLATIDLHSTRAIEPDHPGLFLVSVRKVD